MQWSFEAKHSDPRTKKHQVLEEGRKICENGHTGTSTVTPKLTGMCGFATSGPSRLRHMTAVTRAVLEANAQGHPRADLA